jgi:hypothetical protein
VILRCVWLFLLAGVIAVSGCAPKLPRTLPVSGAELEQVENRLHSFLAQVCVTAVDSDVRVQGQAYGRQESWPAVLQAMAGGFVRFSVNDPLGRPVLLLTVDGADKTFVLADNSKSVGYRGALQSGFIREYLPEAVAGSDLFYWLSGRFERDGMEVLSMARDATEPLFWYTITYSGSRGQVHLIGLDEQGLLKAHLLVDNSNDAIIFAARYSGYTATVMDCSWPGRIEVSGRSLAADVVVDFSRVYSFKPLEKKIFELQLPAHFTVHTVR